MLLVWTDRVLHTNGLPETIGDERPPGGRRALQARVQRARIPETAERDLLRRPRAFLAVFGAGK